MATAIPDLEPLRVELRGEIQELRTEMERRFNTQTWTIVGTLVALGALLTATTCGAEQGLRDRLPLAPVVKGGDRK